MKTNQEPAGSIAVAVGPAAAIVLAGALTGMRSSIGTTNVALIMACVVVAAGIAGRSAGLATAVAAAVSYNFFHTQPYRSLRIDSGRDMLTVLLLAVLGIVVSETSGLRRSATATSQQHLHAEHALETVAERVSSGAPVDQVWTEVRAGLIAALGLAECTFERGDTCTVGVLPRSGSLLAKEMRWGRGGFELPATGAALAVVYAGRTLGHVVLTPREHSGSTIEQRHVAVALTDQFAVALAMADAAAAHPR